MDRTQDSPDPKRVKMKNDQSGECLFFVMVYIHAGFTFDQVVVEGIMLRDIPPEYRKEDSDWFVLYNPEVRKTLDINLVHTFLHER